MFQERERPKNHNEKTQMKCESLTNDNFIFFLYILFMLFDLEWDVLKATKKMSSNIPSRSLKMPSHLFLIILKKYIDKKRHRVST